MKQLTGLVIAILLLLPASALGQSTVTDFLRLGDQGQGVQSLWVRGFLDGIYAAGSVEFRRSLDSSEYSTGAAYEFSAAVSRCMSDLTYRTITHMLVDWLGNQESDDPERPFGQRPLTNAAREGLIALCDLRPL